MGNEFKSFICYRKAPKEDPNHPYRMSVNVAGLLHHLISNKSSLKNATPALFQEISSPDIQWSENGIKKIVPTCSFFFVAICPDFFNPLLSCYREELKNANDEEALKRIIKRIHIADAQDKDRIQIPISCMELFYAMINDKIQICPVFIRFENKKESNFFVWTDKDITLLKAVFTDLYTTRNPHADKTTKDYYNNLFDKKFHTLFSSVNSPEINYAQIYGWIHNTDWSPKSPEQFHLPTDCPEAAGLEADLRFWLKLSEPLETIFSLYNNARLRAHLAACAGVTYKACIPRRNARSGEIPTDKKYSVNDDNIIYDPLPSNPDYIYPRLPYSLVSRYRSLCRNPQSTAEENQTGLGLSDEFAYWPVNLQPTETEEADSIHVCGVCFGTLIAFHRLTKDHCLEKVSEKNASVIQHGLNLLVALRNPHTPNWPSQWKIQHGVADITGTINQTTLSLSTLLTCGFLSYKEALSTKDREKSFGATDRSHLKNRHLFIKESINYLLDSRGDNDTLGWSYTVDNGLDDALLPTVFVFNVLLKYYFCLEDLKIYFADDPTYREELSLEQEEISTFIHETIHYYFKEVQQPNGSFYAVNDTEESITHTAYVINSLITYCEKFPNNEFTAAAQTILTNAADFLILELSRRSTPLHDANEQQRRMEIKDYERFEDFKFADKAPENYEHCVELIVAEALVKIIQNGIKCDNETLRLLFWLASTYINTVDCRANSVYIRGKKDAPRFPIYYIYYYRMFLCDFIQLLDNIFTTQVGENV